MTSSQAVARHETITIPTYPRRKPRALPALFWDYNHNIYPDIRDDLLGETKKNVDYDAIVMENDHLRLTILPELGGRIWSVYDKNAGKEAVHVPDCVKPGLLWVCGAWVPGGFEFNFPIGHHVDGLQHLPTEIIDDGGDQAHIRIHRHCRRSGLTMDVDIILPAGEARFDLSITVANPSPLSQRWYQWTNVGVPASPNWQFQAKSRFYAVDGVNVDTYPMTQWGRDYSWYSQRGLGDAFMIGCKEDFFGYYDHDSHHGLMHVGPWKDIPGKKYFTWGYRPIFDSPSEYNDSGRDYLEIQTGPLETQANFALLEAGESRTFKGTWFPIRETGSVEWSDRDLVLGVRDGKVCLFATADVEAEVLINDKSYRANLKAGQLRDLKASVAKGDKVEVRKQGKSVRSFVYPLKPRSEKDPRARLKRNNVFRTRHNPSSAQGALANARQYVLHNANAQALKMYKKVLKLKPEWNKARLEYAEALARAGDFPKARREAKKLTDAPRIKAKAADLLERIDRAEERFMQPVLALPEGPQRDLKLAEQYAGYGYHDAAKKLYDKLLKTDGDNPRVQYGLASYYWHIAEDRTRAVEHAERTLNLCPGDRDYLLELAPLYLWAEAFDEFVARMDEAPDWMSEYYALRKFLAHALYEVGRDEEALEALRYAPIPPFEGETYSANTYLDVIFTLAEKALQEDDLDRAETLLELSSDEHLRTYFFLNYVPSAESRRKLLEGLLQLHRGNPDRARDIWASAVEALWDIDHSQKRHILSVWGDWGGKASPESMYARGMCAKLLGDEKKFKQAIRLLRKQARDFGRRWNRSNEPDPYWDALLCELEGDFTKAEKILRKQLKDRRGSRQEHLHLQAVSDGVARWTPEALDLQPVG